MWRLWQGVLLSWQTDFQIFFPFLFLKGFIGMMEVHIYSLCIPESVCLGRPLLHSAFSSMLTKRIWKQETEGIVDS